MATRSLSVNSLVFTILKQRIFVASLRAKYKGNFSLLSSGNVFVYVFEFFADATANFRAKIFQNICKIAHGPCLDVTKM